MKKNGLIRLHGLVQLALCIIFCVAVRAGDIKTSPDYLTAPFDPKINNLPVPFTGHDIAAVFKAFEAQGTVSKKGEFETTAEYQKRLEDINTAPLFGSVVSGSTLAFVLTPTTKYDADDQKLTVKLNMDKVRKSFDYDDSRHSLTVKKEERRRSGTGSNGYGAVVEMNTVNIDEHNVAIHNFDDFPTEKASKYATGEIYTEITLPPAEAKLLKDKIVVLCIATPVSPYASTGLLVSGATYDSPTALYMHFNYVDINAQEFWVYDKTTGKILGKIKP